MDDQLGKLFDVVRDAPSLAEDTLILICSDNGPEQGAGSAGPLRGFKTHLYEGGIRSPFIVWGPKLISPYTAGSTNQQSVIAAIDLVPTILDITGVDVPGTNFDGESLAETLLGRSTSSRNAPIYSRRPPDRDAFHGVEDLPDLAVRCGKWKLLCEYDGTFPEWYDLEQDPDESINLAMSHSQLDHDLTQQLVSWHTHLPQDKGADFVALQETTR